MRKIKTFTFTLTLTLFCFYSFSQNGMQPFEMLGRSDGTIEVNRTFTSTREINVL